MDSHLQRAEKIDQRIHELAAISEDHTAVTRTFGTPAFMAGSKKIFGWMNDAGLETRTDNMGNVRGLLRSQNEKAKIFVIASHMDTVINAGKYDGPLGVLMGLDLLEEIRRREIALPFHIELVAFSDEEGVRFHTTYLGSKVVAGTFDKSLLEKKDKAGTTLLEALEMMNCDPAQLDGDMILPQDWLGYFEIHIEQGPVLYENKIPVAVVTAIAGQKRIEIIFTGMAGHAGTVPMHMRNDALSAAAEMVLETERFASANSRQLVATIGKLDIENAASNVIPGKVICSLDIRSSDDAFLTIAHTTLEENCAAICTKRNCSFVWHIIQQTAPVNCDEHLQNLLSEAITESGFEVVYLVSGAGHDAVPVSKVAPVAMLFVRCFKGISHNPLEDVEQTDIAAAVGVADLLLSKLAASLRQ